MARSALGLSADQIVAKVSAEFRFEIDKSTVNKIRQRAGLGRGKVFARLSSRGLDFDEIRREQLRTAYGAHQRELLGTVAAIGDTIRDFATVEGLNQQLLKGPDAWVKLPKGCSLLWRSLVQHLSQSTIWRDLDSWRSAATKLLNALQELDQFALQEAEIAFDAPVLETTPTDGPRLTTGFPLTVRDCVLRHASGGIRASHGLRLTWREPGMLSTGRGLYLTERLTVAHQEAEAQFHKVVERVIGSAEGIAVVSALCDVEKIIAKVVSTVDTYRFMHDIPGDCDLCPGASAP